MRVTIRSILAMALISGVLSYATTRTLGDGMTVTSCTREDGVPTAVVSVYNGSLHAKSYEVTVELAGDPVTRYVWLEPGQTASTRLTGNKAGALKCELTKAPGPHG